MKYSYKHISALVNKDNFKSLYDSLPTLRKNKVDNLNNLKDKYLSIGVYILLMSMIPKGDYVYLEDKYGKPYFKGNPIYFSLSHSGDYVAVAINDSPVGVDIQVIKDVDYDLLSKKIMSNQEHQVYLTTNDKIKYFYKIFTSKEAYSKFVGIGLKIDFKQVLPGMMRIEFLENNHFYMAVAY